MSVLRHPARPASLRGLVLLVSTVIVLAVLAAVAPAPRAQAAELPSSILDGGYIISDAEFYAYGSMTEAQIQQFLNVRVPTCASGATCLKSFRGSITAQPRDTYCTGATAASNVTAAHMIYVAARSCGINPKVILVMLQKEQGLITSTSPSAWNYQFAMGQNCPDTPTGCSTATAGFWNQVYLGSRQMQIYTKYPTYFRYRAGQYNTIQWSVPASCGTSKVFIKNQATANLYNYTPYRPNIAALAAGWGTGDDCSTYGNRNFYNYYVAWFAPGASSSTGAPAQIPACTVPPAGDVTPRSAYTAYVNVSALNARTAPTTLCATGLRSLSQDTPVTVTGVYGAWSNIRVDGATAWVVSTYLTVAAPAPSSVGTGSAKIGSAGVGDLNGDGTADVVAVRAGSLLLYPGNGRGGWLAPTTAVAAWRGGAVIPLGDFTGNGRSDIGTIGSDGSFWMYPGNGTGGFGAPVKIGAGWGPFTAIIGGFDFNGDGQPDVLARTASGDLYLYMGNGAGNWKSGRGLLVGRGWSAFNTIFASTDFDGDGRPDLMARLPDGRLWLYPMTGKGGWGTARQIGVGWSSITAVFSPGDFDGDGNSDVLARLQNGDLRLYRGNGAGSWAGTVQVGNGWNIMNWIH